MDLAEEIEIVRRALALRKARRIGVLWAYRGCYYVSSNELDPFGSRSFISLEGLRALVEAVESARRPLVAGPGKIPEKRSCA